LTIPKQISKIVIFVVDPKKLICKKKPYKGLKNNGYEETICSILIKILKTLKDNFKFHFKVKKARRA
jgi:hypothetical protein